jgi:putative ABC transport system permease protein
MAKTIISLGICTLIVFLLLYYLLRTDFGIAMRATGNNETMVRAMGVNVSSMKITGLAIANGLTALSGSLITQYQGFADINMGIGIVVSGLGAVMIGETFLSAKSSRNLFAQLLVILAGCILFRLAIAVALSAGVDPNYLRLITALIVLLIVAIGHYRKSPAL